MSAKTKSNNMLLWDDVCETLPGDTKVVNLGRKFTAIDPYSQIREATRAFGPAGQGWGWSVSRVEYPPAVNQIAVLIRLWHGPAGQALFIEQWGQSGLYIDRAEQKKDNDCFKKATTDGITKCLSYLGFNADIFLGKYEDSKYVSEMAEKEKAEKKKGEPALPPEIVDFLQKSHDASKDLDALAVVKEEYRTVLEELGMDSEPVKRAIRVWRNLAKQAGA